MPLIFETIPGSVLAVKDGGVAGMMSPPLVEMRPNRIQFQSQKSIFTRLMLAHAANYQFLHTLGGDIYIYVFGDRIGDLTLSGLSFSINCEAKGDREHGLEKMLKWWKANRLSKRKEPVQVMVGLTPIQGFVTNFSADTFDHSAKIIQFVLSLKILPEKDWFSTAGTTAARTMI